MTAFHPAPVSAHAQDKSVIQLSRVSSRTMIRRCDEAHEVFEAATRELAHWAVQAVYATLLEIFPTAHHFVVDASCAPESPCRITRVLDVGGGVLYNDNDDSTDFETVRRIKDLAHDLASIQGTGRHPGTGWRALPPRRSGLWEVSLDPSVTPMAVMPSEDATGQWAAVVRVVRAAMNTWDGDAGQAAREYARGLVQGRYHPLTAIDNLAEPVRTLGYTLDPGLHRPAIGPGAWRTGIATVHGLAAGVVTDSENDVVGDEDDLHRRVCLRRADLTSGGLTLRELVDAFAGDVRRAAMAIRQAAIAEGYTAQV